MKLWKSAWRRAAAMALVSVLLGGFILYLYVPIYPGGYQHTYLVGLKDLSLIHISEPTRPY